MKVTNTWDTDHYPEVILSKYQFAAWEEAGVIQ